MIALGVPERRRPRNTNPTSGPGAKGLLKFEIASSPMRSAETVSREPRSGRAIGPPAGLRRRVHRVAPGCPPRALLGGKIAWQLEGADAAGCPAASARRGR